MGQGDEMADDQTPTVEQLQAELRQARDEVDTARQREASALTESDRLRRNLTEAREQRAALMEILRGIVASGGNASRILEAIAEQAAEIGRAEDVLVYRVN